MHFQNILVHVDATPQASARIDVALELAASHRAQIVGLFVEESSADGKISAEAARAASSAEKIFRRLTEGAPIPVQWFSAPGSAVATVTRKARWSDLIVLGQSAENGADLPVRIALSAGRPVLVVPPSGNFPVIGRQVLVAWSDSREAARALNDALPIITAAERAIVLHVNLPRTESNSESWQDVPGQLAERNVKATIQQAFTSRTDVGKTILGRALEAGADLIVMGARGKINSGQLTLGGTTGYVLANTTLPLFISN